MADLAIDEPKVFHDAVEAVEAVGEWVEGKAGGGGEVEEKYEVASGLLVVTGLPVTSGLWFDLSYRLLWFLLLSLVQVHPSLVLTVVTIPSGIDSPLVVATVEDSVGDSAGAQGVDICAACNVSIGVQITQCRESIASVLDRTATWVDGVFKS
ncbi:hypothetical protein IQ07DRAFT_638624 [Pyrenochaeta sp. DS3sAY3a]|nr:hypothetical protein IQ07DRAFT_638624 [Pyrenochaeta sp. DS3sAY3a]